MRDQRKKERDEVKKRNETEKEMLLNREKELLKKSSMPKKKKTYANKFFNRYGTVLRASVERKQEESLNLNIFSAYDPLGIKTLTIII